MKTLVIDANIFVKPFLQEEDSEKAREFLSVCLENDINLLVPSLFQYEAFSVLRKKGIGYSLAKRTLLKFLNVNLKVVEFDLDIAEKAFEISSKGHKKTGFPTFYDSSYHALAMLNDCDFITADRRHYEKTKELGHIRLLSDEHV